MEKSELRDVIREEIQKLDENVKDTLLANLKKMKIDVSRLVLINRPRKETIDVYSTVDVYDNKKVDYRDFKNIAKKQIIIEVPYNEINNKEYLIYVKNWLTGKM